MKHILYLLIVIGSLVSTHAVTRDYFTPGGTNFVKIGVVFATTTLDDAVTVLNSSGVLDMNGSQAYIFNAATQQYSVSTWDDLWGGWYPNLTITAGQGMYVRTAPGNHTVRLTGTVHSGSKTISILPGWNFLASTWENYYSPATPVVGDEIHAVTHGRASWQPFIIYYGNSSGHWEQSSGFQTDPLWVYGTGFFFYNSTGTTKTFNQSYF